MKTIIRLLFLLVLLFGTHACMSNSDWLSIDENCYPVKMIYDGGEEEYAYYIKAE